MSFADSVATTRTSSQKEQITECIESMHTLSSTPMHEQGYDLALNLMRHCIEEQWMMLDKAADPEGTVFTFRMKLCGQDSGLKNPLQTATKQLLDTLRDYKHAQHPHAEHAIKTDSTTFSRLFLNLASTTIPGDYESYASDLSRMAARSAQLDEASRCSGR